jgi:hypothetical protein
MRLTLHPASQQKHSQREQGFVLRTGSRLAVALAALTILIGCTSHGSEPRAGGSPRPAAVPPASAIPIHATGSCSGVVELLRSTDRATTLDPSTKPHVTLNVGDTLTLVASGPCGHDVRASSGPGGALQIHGHTLTAVRPGTTVVTVGHAMCAVFQPPVSTCMGGYASDGTAIIRVSIARPTPSRSDSPSGPVSGELIYLLGDGAIMSVRYIRPSGIVSWSGDGAYGIRAAKWESWGAAVATGTATGWSRCLDCAKATPRSDRVRVELSVPTRECGLNYYSRVQITSLDGRKLYTYPVYIGNFWRTVDDTYPINACHNGRTH